MNPIRVLIADDEELGRMAVRLQLTKDQRFTIVAEATNGRSALRELEKGDIDLAFLDIHMPGLTGIEVAARHLPTSAVIVFVTAHSEHALEAFSVRAVDYITKPIDGTRFRQTLERIIASHGRSRVIHFEERGRSFSFSPDELILAEASGNYVEVLLDDDAERRRIRTSMKAFLAKVDDLTVIRVHRAFAVGKAFIRGFESMGKGSSPLLVLKTGHKIPVGRSHRSALQEHLKRGD